VNHHVYNDTLTQLFHCSIQIYRRGIHTHTHIVKVNDDQCRPNGFRDTVHNFPGPHGMHIKLFYFYFIFIYVYKLSEDATYVSQVRNMANLTMVGKKFSVN